MMKSEANNLYLDTEVRRIGENHGTTKSDEKRDDKTTNFKMKDRMKPYKFLKIERKFFNENTKMNKSTKKDKKAVKKSCKVK